MRIFKNELKRLSSNYKQEILKIQQGLNNYINCNYDIIYILRYVKKKDLLPMIYL